MSKEGDSSIILGKLDFSQIETEIKSFVEVVNTQLTQAVGAFDSALGKIKKSVQDIANETKKATDKVNSASNSGGGNNGNGKGDGKQFRLNFERELRGSATTLDEIRSKIQNLKNMMASNEGKEFLSVSKILQAEREIDNLTGKLTNLKTMAYDALAAATTGKDVGIGKRVEEMFAPNETLRKMSEFYKQMEVEAKASLKGIQDAAAQATREARQQSQALHRELGQKSYFESVYSAKNRNPLKDSVTELEQLRMKSHELQAEMKAIERVEMNKALAQFNRLGQEIDSTKARMATIREEMQRLGSDNANAKANRGALNQLEQEYKSLENTIARLKQEQQSLTGAPTGRSAERMTALQHEYQNINAQIRAMGQELVNAEILEQRLAAAAKQVSETWSKRKGEATFTDSSGQQRTVQAKSEAEALEKVLKIEKDLLETEKQRVQVAAKTPQTTITQGYTSPEAAAKSLIVIQKAAIDAGRGVQKLAEDFIKVAYAGAASEKNMVLLGKAFKEQGRTPADFIDTINKMQRAYQALQDLGVGESPLAKSLKDTIDRATKARETLEKMGVLKQGKDVWFLEERNAQRTTQSLKEMHDELARLNAEFDKLSQKDAMGEKGAQIAQQIGQLKKDIQELESIKSTNVGKSLSEIFAMPEKSIDNLSKKIRELQNYRGGLNLKTQANEARAVESEISRLQQRYNQLMGQNNRLMKSNNALSRSFNYIKNRLAYTLTLVASTSFVKQIMDIRAQYEMLERGISVLIDSAKQGHKIFNELNAMALKSPFTTLELGAAAKQLSAYDVAASEIVDTTRRLADMAAAAGVPIERLTYSLGHIKAYGYLNSRDARMFANAGIPLVKQLADYYSKLEGEMVSVSDVYDRIKKKAVGFEDVMGVMKKMTDSGGKYFNYQEKMAGTLRVELANLTLAYNNMLNDIGASNQGMIMSFVRTIKELMLAWKSVENVLLGVGIAYAAHRAKLLVYGNTMKQTAARETAMLTISKKKIASKLQEVGSVSKLTAAEQKQYAAELKSNLQKMKLSRTEAFLIGLRNRHNQVLIQQMVATNKLRAEQAEMILSSNGLSTAMMKFGASSILAGKQMKTGLGGWLKNNWFTLALMAVTTLFFSIKQTKDEMLDFGNTIRTNNEESIRSIKEFINSYRSKIDEIGSQDKEEGTKLWLAMRDEIEKSIGSAEHFIAVLEGIPDIKERIEQGRGLLERAAKVQEKVSMRAETFMPTQDVWGGMLGEGLSSDAKDAASSWAELQREVVKTKLPYTEFTKLAKGATFDIKTQATEIANLEKRLKSLGIAYNSVDELNEQGVPTGKRTFRAGGYELVQSTESDLRELRQEVDKSADNIVAGLKSAGLNGAEEFMIGYGQIKEQIKTENQSLSGEMKNLYLVGTDENVLPEIQKFYESFDLTTFKQQLAQGNADAIAIADQLRWRYKDIFGDMTNDQIAQYNFHVRNQNHLFEEARRGAVQSIEQNSTAAQILYKELEEQNADTFANMSAEQIHWWLEGSKGSQAVTNALANIKEREVPDVYNAVVNFVHGANMMKIQIPVILKWFETKQEMDAYQQDFQSNFAPQLLKGLEKSTKQYIQAEKQINTLNKKADEANDAWHKRIESDWQASEASLKINRQMLKTGKQDASVRAELEKTIKDQERMQDYRQKLAAHEGWGTLKEKGSKSSTPKKKGTGRSTAAKQESELAKTLKEEISALKNINKIYKDFTKIGADEATAIELAIAGYDETFKKINDVLAKNNIPKFDVKQYAGKDVKGILDLLQSQLNSYKGRSGAHLDAIETLETTIRELRVEVLKTDLSKVMSSLESSLTKIDKEYEIGVEVQADPEIGNLLSDMFGMAIDNLPKNAREAIDKLQAETNKMIAKWAEVLGKDVFKEHNIDTNILTMNIDQLRNMPEWSDMNNELIELLEQAQEKARDMLKTDFMKTEQVMDEYIERYGTLSDRLTSIEKQRLEDLRNLNEVYNTEELRKSIDYQNKLRAINSRAEKESASVRWEDFKADDYYITMFERLDYVSQYTLETMRDRLLALKDSLKDLDPTNLKEVLNQIQKIEMQMAKRSPFSGVFKNLFNVTKGWFTYKRDQEELANLNKGKRKIEDDLTGYKARKADIESRGGYMSEEWKAVVANIANSELLLEAMNEQYKELLEKVEKYSNLVGLTGEQLIEIVNKFDATYKSLESFTSLMQDTFKIDLGDVWGGFMDGMKMANDGLSQVKDSVLQMASGNFVSGGIGLFTGIAKLGAGIWDGIASIFGGGAAKTKRLDRKIKESEKTVKSLQNAYKDLEWQVNKSLGGAEFKARRLAITNKKLELAEIERQQRLEKQKRKKDRDDNKIAEYQSQINDLRREISDLSDDVANTLLGGDVKSAAEDFVDTWLEAWKSGEDAMDAMNEKFDEMIETMIKKSLASKIVAKNIEKIWQLADEYTSEDSEGGAEVTMNELQKLKEVAGDKGIVATINQQLGALYDAYGIAYGSGEGGELSQLQQGIQGITEDTAGALEAITSGMSQQVYYHSTLLEQIRDVVVMMNGDVQLATNAQMLLQLQQSYQVQVAIQNILGGWSNASGMAVRVQMI